ncbi:hypothetical protein JCM6882_003479 [Rhodosporidiobolus microsporus]
MPPSFPLAYKFSFFAEPYYPASTSLFDRLRPPSQAVQRSEEKEASSRSEKKDDATSSGQQLTSTNGVSPEHPVKKKRAHSTDEADGGSQPKKRMKPDQDPPFNPPTAPKAMLSTSFQHNTNDRSTLSRTSSNGASQPSALGSNSSAEVKPAHQAPSAPSSSFSPASTNDKDERTSLSTVHTSPALSKSSSRSGFEPTLTDSQLFPSLRGLTIQSISQQLQSAQPNKVAIRSAVSLQQSRSHKGLPEALHLRIRALRDTMRWIWDDKDEQIRLEHAAWLVSESSRDRQVLPIYILLREHSSTLRFSDAVDASQRELLTYLTSSPRSNLSPRERRALTLLEWLNEDTTRWHTFFSLPDRSLRSGEGGEESWEWWLKEPEKGEYRDKRALDDWEGEMMRKEEWRK